MAHANIMIDDLRVGDANSEEVRSEDASIPAQTVDMRGHVPSDPSNLLTPFDIKNVDLSVRGPNREGFSTSIEIYWADHCLLLFLSQVHNLGIESSLMINKIYLIGESDS